MTPPRRSNLSLMLPHFIPACCRPESHDATQPAKLSCFSLTGNIMSGLHTEHKLLDKKFCTVISKNLHTGNIATKKGKKLCLELRHAH